ncbi:MAG: hypothetical protein Q8L84_15065, partial [Hyphomonas sp.]|nr:hypothetical protein [Hyphomonas sp.]
VSVYYKPAPDEPEQRGFITTEEAMSTAAYREQIIDDVMGQIKTLARKAAAFKELAEILSEAAGRIQKLFPAPGR